MKLLLTLFSIKNILLILSFSFILQFGNSQISIIGPATPAGEYFTDFNLVQDLNQPSVWTGQIILQKDLLFKFRANNDWEFNWGAITFPAGDLIFDGPDISVDSTANYQMTFDSSALIYSFVIVDNPAITLTEEGQVGIGVISPSESAKLDIQSTTKGLLPPRTTKEQRDVIINPVAGLMLWCSDCGTHGEIQVYNGIKWTNFIGGNASTTPFPSTQQGMDIDGEATGDQSGRSVSLSSDGTRLAIGATFNDGNGLNSGHVRVYEWNGIAWQQIGADLDGQAAFDESGVSVSLSSDGSRLAVGAPKNDVTGLDAGHALVYEWDGNAWGQLGLDIYGEAAGDDCGRSVSLSSNGIRLAIGSSLNDDNGPNSGHVRVYEWDGSTWVQLGGDIEGEAANDHSGGSVSLSSDGSRLAIGAVFNDSGGINAGHVRVYDWDGSDWIKLGIDINGEAASDLSGGSVSLSSDGSRLAIGAVYNAGNGSNSGHVRTFEWNGSMWVQFGSDIDGEDTFNESGGSVSLSADGERLAVGAKKNDGNGLDSGHVRLYEWDGSSWVQLGIDIDGEAAFDESGVSVSLSSDGKRLAIGARENGAGGSFIGHVRVYE